jgi:hypothetical protein
MITKNENIMNRKLKRNSVDVSIVSPDPMFKKIKYKIDNKAPIHSNPG